MGRINKKRIFFIVIAFFTAIVGCFLFFYISVTDTKNVNVTGYVYNLEDGSPINNATVIINNERYLSDDGHTNYDEYLGKDIITLKTNNDGKFDTIIERSAFLWINASKNNYLSKEVKGEYSKKRMIYEIKLKPIE